MAALFISDLHLSEDRPAANEQFFAFLGEQARSAEALYILGDFFEYWIGDDDLGQPFHAGIARGLQELSAQGVALYFMHGNRDFLIGERFCAATGGKLLADPVVIDLFGKQTLLMHGDTLCTDDVDYQAWRRTARSAKWQHDMLAKPLEERRAAVLALRDKSKEVIRQKPAEIMDVNAGAVKEAFRRHGVQRMIHGHTHRPGRHTVEVDGQICERWVLPDWYETGGFLAADRAGARLLAF